MNDIYPPGTQCEVTRHIIPNEEPILPTYTSTKANIPLLYKALKAAKNKAEAGAAMRKFIVWNEVPEDVWEKLEEWFPIKK